MLAILCVDVIGARQEDFLEIWASQVVQLTELVLLLEAASELISVLVHEVDRCSSLQRGTQFRLVNSAVPDNLEGRFRVCFGVRVHDRAERGGLRLGFVPH